MTRPCPERIERNDLRSTRRWSRRPPDGGEAQNLNACGSLRQRRPAPRGLEEAGRSGATSTGSGTRARADAEWHNDDLIRRRWTSEGGMESRGPAKDSTSGRSKRRSRGLPQDLRGRRLQDSTADRRRSSGRRQAAGDGRKRRRSRRGSRRDHEEAGTAKVHPKDGGRRPAGEVHTASRPGSNGMRFGRAVQACVDSGACVPDATRRPKAEEREARKKDARRTSAACRQPAIGYGFSAIMSR